MSSACGGVGVPPGSLAAIIKERTHERKHKAKDKRVRDLELIFAKNLGRLDPLEIFPMEIWAMILNELDPKDKSCLWLTHSMFCRLLENSKIRDILFPLFVRIQVDRVLNSPTTIKMSMLMGEAERYWTMNGHNNIGNKQLSVFLRLREVSKSLRFQVDRALEESILKRMKFGDMSSRPHTMNLYFHWDYDRPMKIVDRIIAGVTASVNKPLKMKFPLRSLTFGMFWCARDLEFLRFNRTAEKLTQLLGLIGDQIWHFGFHLKVDRVATNVREPFFQLRNWLMLMPNLKWIQFDINLVGCGHTEDQSIELVLDYSCLEASSEYIALKDLERMDFKFEMTGWNCRDECLQFTKTLLRMNPHVTILSSPQFSLQLFTLSEMNNLVEPNWNQKLKRADIKLDAEGSSMASVLRLLLKFPNLEQLSLDVVNVTIGGRIDFIDLPSLKHIDMRIHPAKIKFENEKESIPFGELTWKKIVDGAFAGDGSIQFFFSLQFLLYSKKLESIKWILTFPCPGPTEEWGRGPLQRYMEDHSDPEKILGFEGGLTILTHSNLWKAFPSLKQIDVGIVEYLGYRTTREGWCYRRGFDSPSYFLWDPDQRADGTYA